MSSYIQFFIAEFSGTLVSDFWGAYNAVACSRRQMCLVHLLRDLEHVDKYKRPGEHWPAFARKLRRLVADAIRLWYRRDELTAEQYQPRRDRLHKRIGELIVIIRKNSVGGLSLGSGEPAAVLMPAVS